MSVLVGLACSLTLASSSYVPPYYEGTATVASVVSLDPPDFRGEDVFRIEFNLNAKAGMPQDGFVHRSWGDFQEFNSLMRTHHPFIFGLDFPSEPTIENLDGYISRVMSHASEISSSLVGSHDLDDFLGINWSGSDLAFMESLEEFMKVVIPQAYRAPQFSPEPPVFDNEKDAISSAETPFEVYAYLKGFRSQSNLAEYQQFFAKFTDTYPAFTGLSDDSDVQPEGFPCDIPDHFNKTFVHFLPGGYLNGHTVRFSYLGKSKFNFLHESLLKEWLTNLHGAKPLKRILDIGTGPGFSAIVLAEMFPEAEVVALDLAAPYIRMARMWAEMRNITNIKFYQANAEDMSWLESETFDFINYAYVLHEMPADNAIRVVNEMYRLLKVGGTMNGFEVPFVDNLAARETYVLFNTWGHSWQEEGGQGPEPYMEEYEFGVQLTNALATAGFNSVEFIDYSYFEGIFLATK